jgi:hypothetical protein
LARLGTPVAFLGRLGEDAIGQQFKEVFEVRREGGREGGKEEGNKGGRDTKG